MNWTPSTGRVRDAYVRAMRNAFIASAGEHGEEFDRWLREHDEDVRQEVYRTVNLGPIAFAQVKREAAAEALEEAARIARTYLEHDGFDMTTEAVIEALVDRVADYRTEPTS